MESRHEEKMLSGDMNIATLIILLIVPVLFIGCIEEKDTAPAPELQEQVNASAANSTLLSGEENIPEIKITSFSSVYMHDNSDNKNIYLFTWENVPRNQSSRLLNFLKNDFNINWAENAQIRKDEDKTIHVFTDENSIELRLYNDSAQSWVRSLGLWIVDENGTHNVYYKKYQNRYEVSEKYYAVYNLSIRNNGPDILYFKLDELRLHEGDRIFNATALEPYGSSLLEVLKDLEKENKIQDTTLLPGQSLNGTVAFRVDSLYTKSFLLMYNTTPITSASFEKSIDTLRTAESFNYSIALGIPPYCNCSERGGTTGSYEPLFDDNCDTWAKWVNRSIFETYRTSDQKRMQNSPPDNIPLIEMAYALRVFPEKNISMFPVTTKEFSSNLLVIDETGEEIINTSRIAGVAVMRDQTYTLFEPKWKLIMPRMNFSNATVVRISFNGNFGWPTAARFSYVNQDVILDDKSNIIAVKYNSDKFVS